MMPLQKKLFSRNNKNQIKHLFIFFNLFLFFIASSAEAAEPSHCQLIDGPAKIRQTPNGKLITELPDKVSVSVLEKKGAWVKIRALKDQGDKEAKFKCWTDDMEPEILEGWTHKKNLNKLTAFELSKIDPCALNPSALSNSKKNIPISIYAHKQDCICADWETHNHWNPLCRAVTFKSGERIGAECSNRGDTVVCSYLHIGNTNVGEYICPQACTKEKVSEKLTEESRLKTIETMAKKIRTTYEEKLPTNLIRTLTKEYPNWIPYMADSSRKSDYQMNLFLRTFFFKLEFDEKLKKEPLWIVLFYRSAQDLLSLQLAWTFYQEKPEQFWSELTNIPLRPEGYLGETEFCIIKKTPGPRQEPILIADTMIDESHIPHGIFLLNQASKKGPTPFAELKKFLGDQFGNPDIHDPASQLVEKEFGVTGYDGMISQINPECILFSK